MATGETHLNGHVNVAFITVDFPRNTIVRVNVSWLSPVKIRTTLIGGEKKMLVCNDPEADEKIKVYDKGAQMGSGQGLYDLRVSYRSGDMWAPASSRRKRSRSSSTISSTLSCGTRLL